MPKRIQRKRTKGWRMPPDTVYVGRPTKWENLFVVGKQYSFWANAIFSHIMDPMGVLVETQEMSLRLFRLYAELRDLLDPLWLQPLRGKNLACWCPLDQPCHADVLLELANKEAR